MANGDRRIRAELAVVALIVASLGGTLHLVTSIHRQVLKPTQPVKSPVPPVVASVDPVPTIVRDAPPPQPIARHEPPEPEPEPAPEPAPPAEDPTEKALAELNGATAREIEAAKRLDQEAERFEQARRASTLEAEKWKRRELLVKQQIAAMARQVEKVNREVDEYAAQRDVLARERDALKAAHESAPGEGSYAVLPYQGANGTWRRPIVIECAAGAVTIRPDGPTFTMLELSGLVNPRSSPVVVAIAKELLKVQTSASPDGSPVVPYFVFLVRPDGIRAYYDARARLEPLGIAFGYELVNKDVEIHVPNYDDLATWDGSPGVKVPSSGLAGAFPSLDSTAEASDGAPANASGGLSWPGVAGDGEGFGTENGGDVVGRNREAIVGAFGARGNSQPGGEGHNEDKEADSLDDFIWSSPAGSRSNSATGRAEVAYDDGQDTGSGSVRHSPNADADGLGGLVLVPSGRGSKLLGDQNRPAPSSRGLGSLVEGLPDFERVGTEAVGDDRPSSDQFEASARSAQSSDPEERNPELQGLARNVAPIGTTIPGRSWRSDGSGGAVGRRESKPTDSPASDNEDEPRSSGGLMWGDDPATADGPSRLTPLAGARESAVASDDGFGQGDTGESGQADTSRTGSDAAKSRKAGAGRGGEDSPRTQSNREIGLTGQMPDVEPGSGSIPKTPKFLGLGLGAAGVSPLGLGSTSGEPMSPGLLLGAEMEPKRAEGGRSTRETDPGSSSSDVDPTMEPLIKDRHSDRQRPPAIEVPFEIVVACGRDGLKIQPGGYRITSDALRERRGEELFVRNLAAVARKRAAVDPTIRPRPRIRFLIENDGAENFWEARRQVLFSELNWPMTLQVAGIETPRPLSGGFRR